MYEVEFKYLGNEGGISQVVQFLTSLPSFQEIERKEYTFETKYYDFEDQLYEAGYSLRSREANPTHGFKPSVELKGIGGKEDGCCETEAAKRIELTHFDDFNLSTYFSLLSDQRFPKCVPKIVFERLEEVFSIVTSRVEITGTISINGETYKIEICKDYLYAIDKQGNKITEPHDELEVEMKGNVDTDRIKEVDIFLKPIIMDRGLDKTFDSKPKRIRNQLRLG